MPVPPHAEPLVVQVTHTYGRGFPFGVPVQTAASALANGIKSARQFFYMEDQYFVGSPKMEAAIRDALSSGAIGIINIASEPSVGDLPDLPFRRRAFLAPLVNQFPDQFLVFERLGNGSPIGPGAYVHTKLLIVDDEAALIGSVNSSRRSWSHDSEIDATIVDVTGRGQRSADTRLPRLGQGIPGRSVVEALQRAVRTARRFLDVSRDLACRNLGSVGSARRNSRQHQQHRLGAPVQRERYRAALLDWWDSPANLRAQCSLGRARRSSLTSSLR